MSEHSLLSPSSSKEWINCSGSFLLPHYEEEKDTTAADEGTLMHELSAFKLMRDEFYDYQTEIDELRKKDLYHPVMEHYSDNYVSFIKEKEFDQMLVEKLVDLSFLYPDFFGTSDCILMKAGDKPQLEVIDLKYGRWEVNPKENTQLMLYALGAVTLFQKKFPEVKRLKNFPIKLTIYQPRIDNIETWVTDWKSLTDWNNRVLIPALGKIKYNKIEENEGEWCRFCKGRFFCQKFNNHLEELLVFAQPQEITALSDSEIEQYLTEFEEAEKYVKDLKSYVSSRIKDGQSFEKYKLVAGRNTRVWNDTDKLSVLLQENGVDGFEIISPAKLEKKVGKEEFRNNYEGFVDLKQGNPILVKKEDRRKELTFEN